uniref:ALK and LTK ligand 1 n=1 Tax=Anas platyrhynchos platyrhynchos TaxID=8840 RepID=A0A493TZD6_ANAPP
MGGGRGGCGPGPELTAFALCLLPAPQRCEGRRNARRCPPSCSCCWPRPRRRRAPRAGTCPPPEPSGGRSSTCSCKPWATTAARCPPRPPRRDRVISRRYSGGAPPPDPRPITAAAAAPRQPPAVREIFPRDSSLKDKFIKHFTGPVTFSSECSKHFHRLYHNTRDCSTPAYYKRCARLLTRLAMSPLCTQS